jgi:hypothetical protein
MENGCKAPLLELWPLLPPGREFIIAYSLDRRAGLDAAANTNHSPGRSRLPVVRPTTSCLGERK